MGKVETVVRAEIVRLARKELRGVLPALSRDVRELKRIVSGLRRSVSALEKLAAEQARRQQADLARLEVPEEELKVARLSPALIRKLRGRLGITQAELAALVGVSTGAVVGWEGGIISPRGSHRAAIIAVRKLGRREVRGLLEQKKREQPAKPAKRRRARRRKAAKR